MGAGLRYSENPGSQEPRPKEQREATEMEVHHHPLPVLLERRRGKGGAAEIDSSIRGPGKHMLWPGLLAASICQESFAKLATKLKLAPWPPCSHTSPWCLQRVYPGTTGIGRNRTRVPLLLPALVDVFGQPAWKRVPVTSAHAFSDSERYTGIYTGIYHKEEQISLRGNDGYDEAF